MRADETNHPRGVGGRADTVYISYFRGGELRRNAARTG